MVTLSFSHHVQLLKNPILRAEVYVKMLSRLPRFSNAYFSCPPLTFLPHFPLGKHTRPRPRTRPPLQFEWQTIITRSLPFNCQITGAHSSAFSSRKNRIRIACPRKLTEKREAPSTK